MRMKVTMKEGEVNGMLIGAAPRLQQKDEDTVMALVCALCEEGAWAEGFRLLLRMSAAGKRTAPLFILAKRGFARLYSLENF